MNSQQQVINQDRHLDRLIELGKEYEQTLLELAQAEFEYSSIKTQTILILKDQGETATSISNMINGIKEVAQARLSRDIASAKAKSKIEQINIYKLKIKSMEKL